MATTVFKKTLGPEEVLASLKTIGWGRPGTRTSDSGRWCSRQREHRACWPSATSLSLGILKSDRLVGWLDHSLTLILGKELELQPAGAAPAGPSADLCAGLPVVT